MGFPQSPDFPEILNHFCVPASFQRVHPYGDGHINDTYLAEFRDLNGQKDRYILQRINRSVFKKPRAVMENMVRVTEHIRRRVLSTEGDPDRKTITLVHAVDGKPYYRTSTGDYWRLTRFIEGAQTYLQAKNLQHYYHVAFAFGEFLALLSDFPVLRLQETIPDFHHTPKRYQAFTRAVEQDPVNRAGSVKPEISFLLAREPESMVLVSLLDAGRLPLRVSHNDTKIDNVMIDDKTGQGLCVIDLDTVMPGLSVFDFGDAVRSGANLGAEDEPDLSRVVFSLEIFDRLTHGFLDAARGILTTIELEYLAFGAKLITLEQGVRFLTDYLNGDIYYKTHRPKHNLDRTRTQLKLVVEMEAQFKQMEAVVAKYS